MSTSGENRLNFDLNVRSNNTHIVANDVFKCRCAKDVSCSDIEPGTMPRAGYFMALDISLGQGPFFMSAGIFKRKEGALDIKQGNLFTLDIDEPGLTRRELARACCFHVLGHAHLPEEPRGNNTSRGGFNDDEPKRSLRIQSASHSTRNDRCRRD